MSASAARVPAAAISSLGPPPYGRVPAASLDRCRKSGRRVSPNGRRPAGQAGQRQTLNGVRPLLEGSVAAAEVVAAVDGRRREHRIRARVERVVYAHRAGPSREFEGEEAVARPPGRRVGGSGGDGGAPQALHANPPPRAVDWPEDEQLAGHPLPVAVAELTATLHPAVDELGAGGSEVVPAQGVARRDQHVELPAVAVGDPAGHPHPSHPTLEPPLLGGGRGLAEQQPPGAPLEHPDVPGHLEELAQREPPAGEDRYTQPGTRAPDDLPRESLALVRLPGPDGLVAVDRHGMRRAGRAADVAAAVGGTEGEHRERAVAVVRVDPRVADVGVAD